MHIVFHENSTQPHQVDHGQWLKKGFKKHGLKLDITNSITQEADIHIVSGNHYAKNHWLGHPSVIWLDRSYYNQVKSGKWASEDWVSIGWMTKNGGRNFKAGAGRNSVKPKARIAGKGSIFLADYDGSIEQADTIRLHPLRESYPESLHDALHRHARAIGYNTTALVTAGLEGLEVICKSKESIMYQSNWLGLLPYADWRYDEVESGELWEHLR